MVQFKRVICGVVALATAASACAPAFASTVRPGDSTISASRAAQAGMRRGAPIRGDSQLIALLPIWLIAAAVAAVVVTVVVVADTPSSP